jgi:hypothetical protein
VLILPQVKTYHANHLLLTKIACCIPMLQNSDFHGIFPFESFLILTPPMPPITHRSLGMELSDSELQDMVSEFDLDKDGMISEAEFMVCCSMLLYLACDEIS